MISQQTINQLHDMHLSFLAGDIKERQADASFCELSFDEQIAVIVDREWHRRRSKRITDLIREGQFCYNSASVLEIDYAQERGLVKKQINELAACSYIENGHNIMIMGATGVEKVISHVRWERRPAATAIPAVTPERRNCWISLRWRGPMALYAKLYSNTENPGSLSWTNGL